jgi:hypothetical protein
MAGAFLGAVKHFDYRLSLTIIFFIGSDEGFAVRLYSDNHRSAHPFGVPHIREGVVL